MKLREKTLNVVIGLGLVFSFGVINKVQAQNLGNIMIASIGLIGPQGEVISYKKSEDQIFIRECSKNTLPSEIESGCRLKEGSQEIKIDVVSFKKLVSLKLKSLLNEAELSQDQRILLEKNFVDLSGHEEDIQRLSILEKKLERSQAFKKEFSEDYDKEEEKALQTEIKTIQTRLSGVEDVSRAKIEVASLIDGLISDMEGAEIRKLLKFSADRKGITFQLLKSVVSVKACDLQTNRNQADGFMCRVDTESGAKFWHVHTKTESGKMVWKDLASGLLVSDILGGRYDYSQASDVCQDALSSEARGNLTELSWALPSRNDFDTLEANGIRKVIDMSRRWFWSSSVDPKYFYVADIFDGSYGSFSRGVRGNAVGSALCVSS